MITERHVLTAAHCAINDDLVSVRLGEHEIGNDTDGANPKGMCREVQKNAPPKQSRLLCLGGAFFWTTLYIIL